MQVQIVKPDGATDTVFHVTDVHVNHADGELIVMFFVNGSIHTISFKQDEWTNFITSH